MSLQDLLAQKEKLELQIKALELQDTIEVLTPIYNSLLPALGTYIVLGKINNTPSFGVINISYMRNVVSATGLIMSNTNDRRVLYNDDLKPGNIDDTPCLHRGDIHFIKLIPFTEEYWNSLNKE
jgi:hypothetical protein